MLPPPLKKQAAVFDPEGAILACYLETLAEKSGVFIRKYLHNLIKKIYVSVQNVFIIIIYYISPKTNSQLVIRLMDQLTCKIDRISNRTRVVFLTYFLVRPIRV